MELLRKQFYIFLIVGSMAFGLDVLLFRLLHTILESMLFCRVLSYSVSTFFAWKLNSVFTFKKDGSFIFYYFGASLAGVQNVILSMLLIDSFQPALSIALGCIWGLFFNFFFQKKKTFK